MPGSTAWPIRVAYFLTAVNLSSSIDTPNMRELYQISPALKLAAPEVRRIPPNTGGLSSPVSQQQTTGKSRDPAGWKAGVTVRCMESLHSFFRMHWEHEPRTSKTAPPRCCRQDAGSTLGFMESEAFFAARGRTRRS